MFFSAYSYSRAVAYLWVSDILNKNFLFTQHTLKSKRQILFIYSEKQNN